MKIFSWLVQALAVDQGRTPKHQASREVRCIVTKDFPSVTPIEAREAWLNFTWNNGGDIPVLVQKLEIDANIVRRRRLLPLFAEEVLLEDDHLEFGAPNDESLIMQYKLTDLGPIWKSEIEQGSHQGTLIFSPLSESGGVSDLGCTMTWNVTFSVLKRQALWQAVTQKTISDACNNLESFLAKPVKLTLSSTIHTDSHPNEIATKWFDFVWRSGGGLPSPPPIFFDREGIERLIAPPFLKERIVSRRNKEVYYTVDNPSLIFAHSHLGRVSFMERKEGINDKIDMLWEVSITPKYGFESFVKTFVETVVRILTINFKAHMEENGKMVGVYPPRGWSISGEKIPLMQVRKDSWVGNVLDAHSKDTRGPWEQSLELFQPQSWGTYSDEVEVSWSTGDVLYS